MCRINVGSSIGTTGPLDRQYGREILLALRPRENALHARAPDVVQRDPPGLDIGVLGVDRRQLRIHRDLVPEQGKFRFRYGQSEFDFVGTQVPAVFPHNANIMT